MAAAIAHAQEDPYRWLEDVSGDKSMAWVKEQNAKALADLEGRPEFRPIYDRTLAILDSKDKIPSPTLLGTVVYNFWKDARNERGLWRRSSLDSYRTPTPAWETVLDVDALAAAEKTEWAFKGADCLPPEYRRCLISLSRGGADAKVVREFDTSTRAFVEGGERIEWRKLDRKVAGIARICSIVGENLHRHRSILKPSRRSIAWRISA